MDDIWKFELTMGHSPDPTNGACVVDATSWFHNGTLDDHPQCVCPVLAAFCRPINDGLNDQDRQTMFMATPKAGCQGMVIVCPAKGFYKLQAGHSSFLTANSLCMSSRKRSYASSRRIRAARPPSVRKYAERHAQSFGTCAGLAQTAVGWPTLDEWLAEQLPRRRLLNFAAQCSFRQ